MTGKTTIEIFAEGSELTPEKRLETLETLLNVKRIVPNTAFRGGSTTFVSGFDDETRKRFLRLFSRLSPVIADTVMRKRDPEAALQWLKYWEEDDLRLAEYEKICAKRNKK